eukprot:1200695-Amphidinium_carterae.1
MFATRNAPIPSETVRTRSDSASAHERALNTIALRLHPRAQPFKCFKTFAAEWSAVSHHLWCHVAKKDLLVFSLPLHRKVLVGKSRHSRPKSLQAV